MENRNDQINTNTNGAGMKRKSTSAENVAVRIRNGKNQDITTTKM